MYEEEYVLDVLVYLLNGWLGFRYTELFLRRRHANRKTGLLLWVILYAVGQFLYGRFVDAYPLYDRFTHVIPYLILLSILQHVFFERNLPRQVFVIASFIAGWEILRFAVSPLAHAILGLWSPFWGWLLEHLAAKEMMPINELTDAMVILNRIAIFSVLAVCRGIQFGVFYLYLRLIGRYSAPMDDELKPQEIWFLLTPCITVLVIDLTLRLMAYSVDNSALMIIYERVPETLVLLPIVSLLLLGIIVSSVILFRSLVEFKDEEKKRLLLENRVADIYHQIEDLHDIYSDMRGLRHDLRAHIASITSYVRNHQVESNKELESYLGGMESTIARLDFVDRTDNPMTDVILHQIRQQAKRKDIAFSADFHYPEKSTFDVYDVSIILNNALTNAIEASEKILGKRCIELRSYERGSLFFIEVENNFDGRLIWEKDSELPSTTKQEKRMHGIGLDNIRRCAKKYNGDVEIQVTDAPPFKLFHLTVMLYRKDDKTLPSVK